jgi:small subunit ribosomal protein S1
MATLEKTTQKSSESFADLFEESMALKEMRQGEVITAEVISIDNDFVIVNAGLKSESLIKTDEFLDDKGDVEVNIGDHVKVSIEKLEDGYGSTLLSRARAKEMQAWLDLEDAMEESRIVTGYVSSKVKGGLRVTVNGIMAFLPGSLVDTRPIKDTTPFENKECELKVIKIDRKRNNVVVSRKAVLEGQGGVDLEALIETLKEGSVVKGIVKNITDYGALKQVGKVNILFL